jgi:hypothetical protein
MRLWNLSTDTLITSFIPRYGLGFGVAHDPTDDTIWTSTMANDNNGVYVGDGLIHKLPPEGGADITTIPDPGGVNGPGIGALDYDPQEHVLWAIAARPVGGYARLYKLDPNTGAILKTCALGAGGTPVDTIAIAHPADLNGRKVILTDLGDTLDPPRPLFALDPTTCGIVKIYNVPVGVTGIDEDPVTGDLIAANWFFHSFYNLGQAPYSTIVTTLEAQGTVDDISLETPVVPPDLIPPTVTYSGNAGTYTVDQSVEITCTAADDSGGSGLASTTCQDIISSAYNFAVGANTFVATATDFAGNVTTGSTTFTIQVTYASLCTVTKEFVTDIEVSDSLCAKLSAAEKAEARNNIQAKAAVLKAYKQQVEVQVDKTLDRGQAVILVRLVNAL